MDFNLVTVSDNDNDSLMNLLNPLNLFDVSLKLTDSPTYLLNAPSLFIASDSDNDSFANTDLALNLFNTSDTCNDSPINLLNPNTLLVAVDICNVEADTSNWSDAIEKSPPSNFKKLEELPT